MSNLLAIALAWTEIVRIFFLRVLAEQEIGASFKDTVLYDNHNTLQLDSQVSVYFDLFFSVSTQIPKSLTLKFLPG